MDSSFSKETLHTSSYNIVKRPTPSRPSLIDVSRNPGDSFMRSFDFATPSPMTFVSSLLAAGPQEEEGEEEVEEEENCRSFSQLLAGAMDPPFPAVEKVFPSVPNTSNNNSGSSFAQRMAARNLESGGKVVALGAARWKSMPISRLSQPPSPYLTIPPGLSPAALLDSPVLIPFTRQAIPSPTTGNFPLPLLNPKNGPNIGSREEAVNEIISNQLESSSFVFKLPPGIPYTFPDLVQEEGHTQMSSHPSNSTVSSSQKGALSIDTSKQEPMSDMVEDGAETKRPFRPTYASEKPADDGYNWRKYGQKQMKRSEYPRSYYRCSFPNCSAKKKVERSHEGQIIQIVYEGEHTHSKPPSTRRKSAAARIAKLAYSSAVTTNVARLPNELDSNELDNLSSVSDPLLGHSVVTTTHLEPSSGSTSDIGCEDLDEPDAKRRKTWETTKVAFEGLKTVRKPRVVVQTKSEVDILDDGYRWRKYGQKVVKGNSYPRSYYKCTSFGCNVRKLVERCSMDKQSVITTYEGKHSHDVPDSENVRRNLSPPHPSQSGIADGNNWDSDGSQVRERLQGALEIVHREPPLTPGFLNKENIMDLYAQMFSSSFNEGD